MLSCGALPPASPSIFAFMTVPVSGSGRCRCGCPSWASARPSGLSDAAALLLALTEWVCSGHLRRRQRHGLRAARLALRRRTRAPRPGPRWIGTRDCRLGKAKVVVPSPPYVVPRRLEQSGVLADRQQLAVAERPALRREVEAEHPDLAEKRLRHCRLLNGMAVVTLQAAPYATTCSRPHRTHPRRNFRAACAAGVALFSPMLASAVVHDAGKHRACRPSAAAYAPKTAGPTGEPRREHIGRDVERGSGTSSGWSPEITGARTPPILDPVAQTLDR
jgi:hypothetical protein